MLSFTTSHETGIRDLPLKRIQSTCRSWVWRSQHRQRALKINFRNSKAPCLSPDEIKATMKLDFFRFLSHKRSIKALTSYFIPLNPWKVRIRETFFLTRALGQASLISPTTPCSLQDMKCKHLSAVQQKGSAMIKCSLEVEKE